MDEYLLEMEHISKSFSGVPALTDVSFNLKPGEVHVLIGENGAGKSTLMNILCGLFRADSGTIKISGETVEIPNQAAAMSLGIAIVHLMEKAMELTDGVGFDMTFLAFGDEPTLQQAAEITKRGGIMQQHALMLDGVGFPYRVHQQHELTFAAYNMYRYDDFEAILAALSEGRMKLDGFVTQRYPIEKFHEALEMADKRPVPVVKVMLEY